MSMKSKTSPLGILPTDILKNCVDVFAVVISRRANLSFEQGMFPTAFKTAQITPLLKKPSLDPELPSSYGPISTPFQRFWRSYSLPGSSHSSWHLRTFVVCNPHTEKVTAPKLLCCTYTMTFSSQWTREGGTVLVSLNLSAAFEMVDHDRLIQRLSDCFGLTVVAVMWLQFYMSNREQFIKIRDHSSRATRVESGIPQGSVLGPFLFLPTCHLIARSFRTR